METHAAVLGSPGCDMRRAEVRDTPQAASIEKPRHTAFDFHNAVPPQLLSSRALAAIFRLFRMPTYDSRSFV